MKAVIYARYSCDNQRERNDPFHLPNYVIKQDFKIVDMLCG